MPDLNRPRPGSSKPSDVDPRQALAQQYLARAEAEITAAEEAKPKRRTGKATSATGPPAGFSLAIERTSFVHLLLVALALTAAALACLFCYHMLHVMFVAGRVIALPAGVVTAAALSYASVCYLGVIESTANGETNATEAMSGDWREWFWTLPTTLGMLAIAAVCGYGLGFFVPEARWLITGLVAFILYPVLQLSSLANGSPLAPLSLDVLRTLGSRPVPWILVYVVGGVLVGAIALIVRLAWMDPPYGTVLIVGPVVTFALAVYAWFMGQLARQISLGGE